MAICLRLGIIEKKIKKVGSFSEVWKMVWLKEGIEVKKNRKSGNLTQVWHYKEKKSKKLAVHLRLGRWV